MTFRIESTASLTAKNTAVKCMVYGGSGVGKTRLARTAPRPIILSAEHGLLSLRKENLPYIRIDSLAQAGDVYEWIIKSREAQQFGTIVLDSASEIAEQILGEERAKTKDGRKAYGETASKMVDMLRDYRDIPGKNVYFIAKQEWIRDEATGVMIYGPTFPGNKLAQAVPYFFDEVFQLIAWVDQASGQQCSALKCRKDAQSEGKDRSGALDLYEPADMTHIFKKIASS